MSDEIEIPCTGPLQASIRPLGSKSITNRAMVCAALADGRSTLNGALESEDTQVMIDGLRQLGLKVERDEDKRKIHVSGCGGFLPARRANLFVANSGTTVRFLAAVVSLGHGRFRLDGSPRMRQRPIADLLGALRQLGVDATDELDTGCPPVIVHAAGLPGGQATVAGDISSQYLSGLLMAAPYAKRTVELNVRGELVSKPYIRMTLAVMKIFGVEVQTQDLSQFVVSPRQQYQDRQYDVEPDASAASYFFAAAAITGGQVTVEGLSRNSLQGDVAFCDCLERMGCEVQYGPDSITVAGRPLHGIDVNMNAISDTVQTLSAVALFADGPTRIHDVANMRHKETDRISALVTELRKFGAEVEEHDDGLRISPSTRHGARIDTYDDHRMAMSMALVGLATSGVVIRNPGCTAKTYPGFFTDLAACSGG